MRYKLTGNVLEGEEEIERLLNLPMDAFEKEINKYTKKELYGLTKLTFEVLGRLENAKFFSIDCPEAGLKDIGRELHLRLD